MAQSLAALKGDKHGTLTPRAKIGSSDIKQWLAHVKSCKYLPEGDVLTLIELV
jgi:hypothetical protein